MEFPTVPKVKRTPVWFSARRDGETILIYNATNHKPSSKITTPRKLNFKIFEKIYPIYLRREKGEPVSYEATSTTVDQVYYSLIKHLCQETKDIG